jgi:hypothetical protein
MMTCGLSQRASVTAEILSREWAFSLKVIRDEVYFPHASIRGTGKCLILLVLQKGEFLKRMQFSVLL